MQSGGFVASLARRFFVVRVPFFGKNFFFVVEISKLFFIPTDSFRHRHSFFFRQFPRLGFLPSGKKMRKWFPDSPIFFFTMATSSRHKT